MGSKLRLFFLLTPFFCFFALSFLDRLETKKSRSASMSYFDTTGKKKKSFFVCFYFLCEQALRNCKKIFLHKLCKNEGKTTLDFFGTSHEVTKLDVHILKIY